MYLEKISISGVLPFDLEKLKAALNIEDSVNDPIVADVAAAGVAYVETVSGRSYRDQTLRMSLPRFEREIYLPAPTTREIVSVEYKDEALGFVALDPSEYVVHAGTPTFIEFADDWVPPTHARSAHAVRITFRAGYADTTSAPEPFFVAVANYAGAILDERPIPVDGIRAILSPMIIPEFVE